MLAHTLVLESSGNNRLLGTRGGRCGSFPIRPLAVAVLGCAFFGMAASAQDNMDLSSGTPLHRNIIPGTLGYGPPGVYPGFAGFGLGYHLGYGYGGRALGVGAGGGYPCYGGPGYPHCDPVLRRLSGINPFCYYGGPGYPTPEHPNFYGGIGPLVGEQPVITVGTAVDFPGDFGSFSGTLPYSEEFLAPFTFRAAAAGSASGVSTEQPAVTPPVTAPSAPPVVPPGAQLAPPTRRLGIDAEPVVDAGGARGMRVTKVYPGTAAAAAGLQAGDVIHSINGRVMEKAAHMDWIMAHTGARQVLEMRVRKASDRQVHAATTENFLTARR